ncbi:MAG: 4'-phosphopantetheinyl transferase superfamily protein [Muribaculaceae bacterium]|nr:4'-phosphopantetheinyl transferase superfamily protein [Muribaculaceae bacterium]
MENEFIYWRHPTIPGIKVEEVSGGCRYKGELWRTMAAQLYCENGKDAYREIGHFPDGAPFLYGESNRISITHCNGLFAVATLPSTPEVDLAVFTPRAAMGIDAERVDRSQVLRVRDRFLSPDELSDIPADDVRLNVLAWTIKEAAYKALRMPGLDFRHDIRISRLPLFGPPTPVFNPSEFDLSPDTKELPGNFFGEVVIVPKIVADHAASDDGDYQVIKLIVYSYLSDEHIVTLCYERKCAKFKPLMAKSHSVAEA